MGVIQQRIERKDPHSFHLPGQPKPNRIEAAITVDFDKSQLRVRQTTTFDKSGLVHLDSRGQTIRRVTGGGVEISYRRTRNKILGERIALTVPEGLRVEMEFDTSPDALGLQWLTPAQADSDHPALYSQSEMINGRSIFIAPDSPSIRCTHAIRVCAPKQLRSLIAAGRFMGRTEMSTHAIESWQMDTPVPIYLIAINVGDFVYHRFDRRSGVWADRKIIERAAPALERVPEVLRALEKLYGPYLWGKADTVLLPQLGFPFGAMEHPCLTSMNAMLAENQYSATRVIIHELTHSWFGNLITNRIWGDFWLNEGVTTFCEWLAIREVYGEEVMLMQIASSLEELRKAIATFVKDGEDKYTRLKVDLRGINPDDKFSRVPYYKGALFLWTIMQRVGEEAMLRFLRSYIATYRYTTIDTEQFLAFIGQELGQDVLDGVGAKEWVYKPGLPANAPDIVSSLAVDIGGLAERGTLPGKLADSWDFLEWDLYLSRLTRSAPHDFYQALGRIYGDTVLKNGMLQFHYLHAALEAEAFSTEAILGQVEVFLRSYGRQVYIVPLYRALCERGYRNTAVRIFEKARPGYHPIGRDQVEKTLKKFEPVAA